MAELELLELMERFDRMTDQELTSHERATLELIAGDADRGWPLSPVFAGQAIALRAIRRERWAVAEDSIYARLEARGVVVDGSEDA